MEALPTLQPDFLYVAASVVRAGKRPVDHDMITDLDRCVMQVLHHQTRKFVPPAR